MSVSDEFSLWGESIPHDALVDGDVIYFRSLPERFPSVQWLWHEMDRVWGEFGLDNKKPLSDQRIDEFYSHPVWLVNGIFTAVDPESVGHRKSIAAYVRDQGVTDVADYGGGFGQLALNIAAECPESSISIVEPFPSKVGRVRIESVPQARFVKEIKADAYDLVTAEDVLEHVEDPVGLAYELACSVHKGGTLIFANCFWPVIACHLPRTFHLRYTFAWVMARMGLECVGRVPGAYHAQVFRRTGDLDLPTVRRAEAVSKVVGPLLNCAGAAKSVAGRLVRGMRASGDQER